MIKLYSGTPGSGKSLHLARDIYFDLNRKYERLVICNFPINLENVKYPDRFVFVSNDDLTPDYVIELISGFFRGKRLKENDVCLYIDECQLLFNARSWNEAGRKEWLSFFTQHRKFGVFCVLVAQFDEMIDKQIRKLIEYECLHRKITNFGFFGLLMKLLTFGDCFISIERWYSINQKIGSDIFKARKKYYSLYDTFNTFDGFNLSEDVSRFNDSDIWKEEDFCNI